MLTKSSPIGSAQFGPGGHVPGRPAWKLCSQIWLHWKLSLKFGPKNMPLVNWSVRWAHKRWSYVKCSLKLGLEDMWLVSRGLLFHWLISLPTTVPGEIGPEKMLMWKQCGESVYRTLASWVHPLPLASPLIHRRMEKLPPSLTLLLTPGTPTPPLPLTHRLTGSGWSNCI